MSATQVGKFIGVLMSSREQAHVFHLTTKSFAAHKALQVYYEAIVPLLDTYAETYMGKNKRTLTGLTPYINRKIYTDARLVRAYFTKLAKTIKSLKLPRDAYLDNIRQEIDALVRQTLYMLSLR
jgi:hypothetical protein